MSPAKRRRRLPTLINRGLGLLEVILPCGPGEAGGRFLPPGQRDASGFWYPAGYDKPGDIFSPMQRELQENQRRIQKRRLRLRDRTPSPAGGDGTVMLGSTGEAHSPPSEPMPAATAAPAGDGVKAEPAGSEIPVPLFRAIRIFSGPPSVTFKSAATEVTPAATKFPDQRVRLKATMCPPAPDPSDMI